MRNTGEVSIPKAIKAQQFKAAYRYTLFDLKGHMLGKVDGFKVPQSYPKGIYLIRAEAKGKPTVTKKVAK